MTDLHFGGLLIVVAVAVRRAVPARPRAAPAAAVGRARDRRRDRHRPVRARLGRGRRAGRGHVARSAWRSCCSSPASRSSSTAARARAEARARSASSLSFAIAVARRRSVLQAAGLVEHAAASWRSCCARRRSGVIVPVLKDAGRDRRRRSASSSSPPASIADFGAVILLSLFFSRRGRAPARRSSCSAACSRAAPLVALAVAGAEHSRRMRELARLQDTTAQIRVRGAFVLLIGFVALRRGARARGDPRRVHRRRDPRAVDRDQAMTHPDFRLKLEAAGFGVFIPVFFVTSGVRYDLGALTSSASNARAGADLPRRAAARARRCRRCCTAASSRPRSTRDRRR